MRLDGVMFIFRTYSLQKTKLLIDELHIPDLHFLSSTCEFIYLANQTYLLTEKRESI